MEFFYICVYSVFGKTKIYKVSKIEVLKYWSCRWAFDFGVYPQDCVFFFNGRKLLENDTPVILKMSETEMNYVEIWISGKQHYK